MRLRISPASVLALLVDVVADVRILTLLTVSDCKAILCEVSQPDREIENVLAAAAAGTAALPPLEKTVG